MKKVEHTIIRNKNIFCTHCGEEQVLTYPVRITIMVVMINAFNKDHKNCDPVWKQPEVDQTLSVTEKAKWWIKNGEHGTSSKTIHTVLSGDASWSIHHNEYCHPLDTDDFRRCYMLLKTVPEWRSRLDEMKSISKVWSALINNWDKLEEMLEEQMKTKKDNGMYHLMNGLIKAAQDPKLAT